MLLSGFTNSVIFGIYVGICAIVLLVLKKTIGNLLNITNRIGYWLVLILLSIIMTPLLLILITTITGKGLLE